MSYITELSRTLLDLYVLHLTFDGALPEAGGLLDQPALLMDAFATCRSEAKKVQDFVAEQDKKKSESEAAANAAKHPTRVRKR